MRLFLLCALFLSLSLTAASADQAPPHDQPAPSLLIAPGPQAAPPARPDWLPAPAASDSAGQPAAAPLIKPAGAAPAAQRKAAEPAQAPVPPPAEPDRQAKKPAKANQPRNHGAAKAVGRNNNVPLLLAAAVAAADKQPTATWGQRFFAQQSLPQVTAFPPLLAGILPSPSRSGQSVQEEPEPLLKMESILTKKLEPQQDVGTSPTDTLDMLASLVELQKNIKQQITATTKKLKASSSDGEKQGLQEELGKLDKQLSEIGADFERIATGVNHDVFAEKQAVRFSWKDEVATLLEPSIKELKQLTARARQKSELKETIADYHQQLATARRAVEHLNKLIAEAKSAKIKTYLSELVPAWQNVEKRISSKLDLAQHELAKLENKNISLLETSGNSMKEFFRDRGLYLLIAFLAFAAILLAIRLLARLIFFLLPGAKKEQRPLHVRILDIFFQFFSVLSAICGLIFVLYLAEDWFLLSMTIILFVGIAWTVRQTLPKMWQQVRLVLNMGSLREGERVVYGGVPWRVESLNVFCKLYNPALGQHLRIPVEDMLGLISRPYHIDEPWFPCKKGDWVAIDGQPLAKVASLSHEQVEVVELGGRRIVYQTGDFLSKSPANLSRNFSLRVVFGLSYDLQGEITTTVLETMKNFLLKRLEEHGYSDDCVNLAVDFLQAGASSLDVAVLADFKGEQAVAYRRLERALARWCVECCNANGWEIPFPQMTVHLPRPSTPEPAPAHARHGE